MRICTYDKNLYVCNLKSLMIAELLHVFIFHKKNYIVGINQHSYRRNGPGVHN